MSDVRGIDQLHGVLPTADVLFVCLPLTSRTEGIIGLTELALLPSQAIIVNVGRGPLIAEAALYQILKERKIKGAGLDVWYNYPSSADARSRTAPSTFPFGELDNVVMSPHRAGSLGKERAEYLRMEALAESLNAAARGAEVPSPVDLQEGY